MGPQGPTLGSHGPPPWDPMGPPNGIPYGPPQGAQGPGSMGQWVHGPLPWDPLGTPWDPMGPPHGIPWAPPWDPMGPPCFGLFGPPIQPKNVKIRPLGSFFMLNSMVKLPDLETPLKTQKIRKNLISKKNHFFFFAPESIPGVPGPPPRPRLQFLTW